jgi:fido (protein-threonine AMPylation protein)
VSCGTVLASPTPRLSAAPKAASQPSGSRSWPRSRCPATTTSPTCRHSTGASIGDVYAWAGELRTVSIGKGALFCPPQRLVSHADQVFSTLARLDRLRGRTRSAFVDGLTGLLAEINYLHPFREGNGRTQRTFLGQLAVDAGHPIHWAAIDPTENVAASKAAHEGDNDALRTLLDRLVHRR